MYRDFHKNFENMYFDTINDSWSYTMRKDVFNDQRSCQSFVNMSSAVAKLLSSTQMILTSSPNIRNELER